MVSCVQGQAGTCRSGGCHRPTTGSRRHQRTMWSSFVAFHERGLGAPLNHFMWAIPHYYGVELYHLAPNFIS
jgi:hypothetical protein